ncbi:glycosyltransferase [Clostridium perfringens]|nr:glycosyltransferase [Clostridium perfringens]MDM0460722.1 glycosyltransferase [Clostridium perfringens]
MKKNIIFVIDSLVCAGAEKSLITLLSLLDYSKYNVDLQLFAYGRPLEVFIPKEVNLLKPFPYTEFCNKSIKESLKKSVKDMDFSMMISRIKYSVALRKDKGGNAKKARLFWINNSSVIESNTKKYDIAISYAQGVPTFYVADKINATKKFAWVNVSYRLDYKEKSFQEKYYKKYNKIVAVSDSARDIFLETFSELKEHIEVIYDINDYSLIKKLAKSGESYTDNFDGIKILTIGRLANQKGYDLALEACKKLKERNLKFRWYVLGVGPLKEEIEKYILENDLQEYFKLLGIRANPYPFIEDCDLYVQTSKFEGFGLAIAEARILNKFVVTTEFDAVYNQMVQRKNGLVVKMNSNDIANGIIEILSDEKLRKDIKCYLEKEKKGNSEEIEKFYKLII